MEIKRSNGTVVTVNDPLDFAYWIMGVKNALALGNIDTGEWDGGEMDFIQHAMDHAGVIDQLWGETKFEEEGCPTVWVYELVEPLGQVCADFLWAGRSSAQIHEALLDEGRRMIKEFS